MVAVPDTLSVTIETVPVKVGEALFDLEVIAV
jgi:hypothetical protein